MRFVKKMNFIPYGQHFIDSNDIRSVSKALKQKKITSGDEVVKFEKKLRDFFGSEFATVCNSGTSALFLAFSSINLKKKENIIMPSINFVASYNVAKLFGANVFLADVNKYTGQMSPEDVIACCKKNKLKKVKVILTMYNGGYPQDAEKFFVLKKKLSCLIIEDACHALGAKYKYKDNFLRIGSCKHADISTFSLHPLKSITTGEGGIVTTNSKILDRKIKELRSLGIKRDYKNHWKYDVLHYGLNLRLNDFQCALGLSQLKKLNLFIKYRKGIAERYSKELKCLSDIHIPNYLKDYNSSYHLYIINFKFKNLALKEKLIKFMLKNNIILQYHYIPLYKFTVFDDKYIGKNAEHYYQSSVSLPIYYGLKYNEQTKVIKLLKVFLKKNIKRHN